MSLQRRSAELVAILALGAAAAGSADADPCSGLAFADAAPELGVAFVHERGATGRKFNPETMGSGLAWLDYDGDGWLDLYLVQSGRFPPDGGPESADRLWRNRAGAGFVDVTATAGVGDRGYGQGVVAADFDGDGSVDLLVVNYGPSRFYANRGDGKFAERTAAAGLAFDRWSSSAALGDVDRDGDLDLYVARYVEHDPASEPFCTNPLSGERWYCGPSVFIGESDAFFRNSGDGTFEDATAAAGFAEAKGKGLGVVIVDLDGDGWAEVYVANDMTVNFLFANRGDGTFDDVSLLSGTAVSREGLPEAGMGLAVGDVDGDRDPDLAVTNYDVQTNTLYVNEGELAFEDRTAASRFGAASLNQVGFGLLFADFDRDGNLDAYVANGHTVENPARANVTYAQPDLLLRGDGRGAFDAVDCGLPFARPAVTRGVALADFDNDGDADVGAQHSGGPFALWRNDTAAGSWQGVVLAGGGANREAVGARVELDAGGATQTRWILAGDSYQSSSDRRALFGLPAGARGTALRVVWPSGRVQEIRQPASGRYLKIAEPVW